MTITQEYTVSFVFDAAHDHVLLIRKNRPPWQAGLLNGVGGHLEDGETPVQCVLRELHEESGLDIPAKAWVYVGEMHADSWLVHVFTAVFDGDPALAQSLTDERVRWVALDALPDDMISNLQWLIPLCLVRLRTGMPALVSARYEA